MLESTDGGRQLVADVEARDKDGKRWYSRCSRRCGQYNLESPGWLSGASSGWVCSGDLISVLIEGRVRVWSAIDS